MNFSVNQLVEHFNLQPHPEGGFYAETYRSALDVYAEGFEGQARSAATGIYYLLTGGNFSSLHRLRSDEMWHFYAGHSIVIVEITNDGQLKQTRLGQDITNSCILQYVVPAGSWFGAYVEDEADYALVGCNVAPGFDFADFELADKQAMLAEYPEYKAAIEKVCRE